MSIAIALHVLFVVFWVGGMAFAMLVLRPIVASQLEPPQQAAFMTAILKRFFILVWHAAIIIPVTGFWAIFAGYGGFSALGPHIHYMAGVGSLMILIFIYLYFLVFLPFKNATAVGDKEKAQKLMGRLRALIWTNLILGVSVVLVASFGSYL